MKAEVNRSDTFDPQIKVIQMKSSFDRYIQLSIIFLFLCIVSGCKNETPKSDETSTEHYIPKGSLADLAHNPIRKDGTIDSSYLPIIKWDESVYDFGTIHEGDVVEKKYTFKNIGTAPLVILTATSTCGCTIPDWPKHHILPDSTGTVTVKFNSLHKEGAQNKEVTIFANTIPNQSKINIKGNVEKSK